MPLHHNLLHLTMYLNNTVTQPIWSWWKLIDHYMIEKKLLFLYRYMHYNNLSNFISKSLYKLKYNLYYSQSIAMSAATTHRLHVYNTYNTYIINAWLLKISHFAEHLIPVSTVKDSVNIALVLAIWSIDTSLSVNCSI